MNITVSTNEVGKYGATKAILVGYIKTQMELNKGKNRNLYQGCYWTGHLKLERIADETGIPYSTVRRNISELVDDFVIVKGNFNKKSYDHTGWYTIPKPDSEKSHFNSFSAKEKLESDLNATRMVLESKIKNLKLFFKESELENVVNKPEHYITSFKEWEKPYEVLNSVILYRKEIDEIEQQMELCKD